MESESGKEEGNRVRAPMLKKEIEYSIQAWSFTSDTADQPVKVCL